MLVKNEAGVCIVYGCDVCVCASALEYSQVIITTMTSVPSLPS